LITNYADLLLQDVVSALEEGRWEKLPAISTLPKVEKVISVRSGSGAEDDLQQ
jgi:hypothetical protein